MNDYFGKKIDELKNKKLFLLDMDGTIYQENELFEGVIEFLEEIKSRGGKYIFITNNSSKSVFAYIDKLKSLGINAFYDDFFTSTQATSLYLEKEHKSSKIYCQGTKSLVNELKENGYNITEKVEENIDVVLLGFDTELTSEKLRNTCEVLLQDVEYIATNPDLVCPVSFGYVPDCGSMATMIKNATGKYPKFIGKPEPTMINFVMNKYGFKKEETLVIGDRLYTDIMSAINAGVTSLCVLSGEATVNDITNGNIKPTFTLNHIKELLELLKQK